MHTCNYGGRCLLDGARVPHVPLRRRRRRPQAGLGDEVQASGIKHYSDKDARRDERCVRVGLLNDIRRKVVDRCRADHKLHGVGEVGARAGGVRGHVAGLGGDATSAMAAILRRPLPLQPGGLGDDRVPGAQEAADALRPRARARGAQQRRAAASSAASWRRWRERRSACVPEEGAGDERPRATAVWGSGAAYTLVSRW